MCSIIFLPKIISLLFLFFLLNLVRANKLSFGLLITLMKLLYMAVVAENHSWRTWIMATIKYFCVIHFTYLFEITWRCFNDWIYAVVLSNSRLTITTIKHSLISLWWAAIKSFTSVGESYFSISKLARGKKCFFKINDFF